MKAVDYSKTLASEREKFYNTLEDNNRNHKREVGDLRATNEKTENKLEAQRFKDKDRMDLENKDRIETMNKATADKLEEKNKQYRNALRGEKAEFAKKSHGNQKEFRDRYNELRDDFTSKNEKSEARNLRARTRDRTQQADQLKTLEKSNQHNVKQFVDRVTDKNNKLKEDYETNQKRLISNHDESTKRLKHDESEKRQFLKSEVVADSEEMKQSNRLEQITRRDKQRQQFKQVQRSADRKIEDNRDASEKEKYNLKLAQKHELRKEKKGFQNQFSAQQRRGNQALQDVTMKQKRSGDTDGSLRNNLKTQDALNKDVITAEKVDRLANERLKLGQEYNQRSLAASDEYDRTYREVKIDSANNLEKVQNEAAEQNFKDRTQAKLDKANLHTDFERKTKFNKDTADNKEKELKVASRVRNDRLKEAFNKNMNKAYKDSRANFETARQQNVIEKKEFMKKVSEENTSAKKELRNDFSNKMDQVSASYEKRISDLEQQNKLLKTNMQDTIADYTYSTNKELSRQKEIVAKDAQVKVSTEKEASRAKDVKLKKHINKIHTDYAKKLNEKERVSQRKIVENTKKLDLQMKEFKDKHNKILNESNQVHEREKSSMQNEFDFRLKTTVTKYEEQIRQLRDRETAKAEQIKQFKEVQS